MLYQVTASNTEGIDGTVLLSNGKAVDTNHPLNDQSGFNPEELISLAWSTCLNATIQSLLTTPNKQTPKSRVDVSCQLIKETEPEQGYYFQVDGKASIQDLKLADAQVIVNKAHQRCPISKLIAKAKTVSLQVEDW